MAKRKWCYLLLIALTLSVKVRSQEDNTMYAHYINVGQGAAVLLEFPCGAMLIDAGASDDSYQRKLIAYLHDFFKRRKDLNNTISLVMVTHPHIDHNKALADIAAEFRLERNGCRDKPKLRIFPMKPTHLRRSPPGVTGEG
jgi:competence protein ComEC